MLDARAWLLWAVTILVAASSIRNPLYAVVLLLVTTVVGVTRAPAEGRRAPLSPLRFATVAIPLAALFNGLTAHLGDTVLLRLPDWLPLLGGPVTLEALVFGATNGLILTVIFSGFAVFNQVTPVRDLVQLTPRAFHEAGVVLSIALTFIPQTTRSLHRIREAQAVRGHRVRGLRDWLPIVVPLLVSGLERSMGLAEAMVARGYGAISDRAHPLRTQGLVALGLLALLGGVLSWLFQPPWRSVALGAMIVGAALILGAVWLAGRVVSRTAYRARRWTAWDTLVALGCGLTLATVLLPLPLVDQGTLYYAPYPRLALPPFDPLIGLGLLGLLVPAAVSGGSPSRKLQEHVEEFRRSRLQRDGAQSVGHACSVTELSDGFRRTAEAFGKVIRFDHLTYTYPGCSQPVLADVMLEIDEGEFVLVAGPSGVGKSTLLRCLNGLVPHFTGGTLSGSVTVAGHDPVAEGPQVLSRVVGFVFQDPEAQFVVDRVEDEIAFALENAAVPPPEMRARVEDMLRLLDLAPLRARPLETLSGGERQRVAIAAALALRPRVLVLDEPTSQLDPRSAEDVCRALVRLNRDMGLTVVLAEHRLERVLAHADRLVYLPRPLSPALSPQGESGGSGRLLSGPPRQVLGRMDLTPPLITLARELGWDPLPLAIEEGRRFAAQSRIPQLTSQAPAGQPASRDSQLIVRDLHFAYGREAVLRGIDLRVGAGELVALMGRNGSGKTTLLKCIVGLLRPQQGQIALAGESLLGRETADVCRSVGYLPQEPDDLLFADTVLQELLVTLHNHGLSDDPPVAPADLLHRLGLGALAMAYPRDLSVGERQRVALGAVTVTRPRLLLLDEPTRGMDYPAKRELVRLLREWRAQGVGVLLVTHDVELVAQAADRVVILSQGVVTRDGSPQALAASSLFAPQVAQLFPGTGWLTVEHALSGLRAAL